MTYPLSGIRVLAMEQVVAAPLCTRHMADLGADVIKIERPDGGDFTRSFDAAVNGLSAYFVWLNRGKRSLALDWKTPEGRATLEKLIGRSDVLVHNLGPGVMEKMGLGPKALRERWPHLISCGISGYGADGPFAEKKAYDLLMQGELGLISINGTPEAPAKVGLPVADIAAGMYALSAILAALLQQERAKHEDGSKLPVGQTIEISLFDALAEWMMPPAYHALYAGKQVERSGQRHNMIVPYGPYHAGNGAYINLAVQNDWQWRSLCAKVLEQPELVTDPHFDTNVKRLQNRAILEPLIEERFTQLGPEEVIRRLDAADVPSGHINDMAGMLSHPQLGERNRWFTMQSEVGPIQALAHPMNSSSFPQYTGDLPAVGQHTAEILAELVAEEQAS